MTDEELGRQWAAANGKRPEPQHVSGGYRPPSWSCLWAGGAGELPAEVLEAVRQSEGHWAETPGGPRSCLSYETDAEAYTALGAAVRRAFAGTRVGEECGVTDLNKCDEVTS